MAVLKSEVREGSSGYIKEIEESAMGLILRNVQIDLYKYPIKSFVREIVSNGVDSIMEKNSAIKILTGEAKVSDYYEDSDDILAIDSKFQPDYYDLANLNKTDLIEIKYTRRDNYNRRDLITISDTGVGIWGDRLRGVVAIGYSTKRLSKALGCFGVGSKSGLATKVESYRITSVHNERKVILDIYEDGYFSVIPRFKEEGVENKYTSWKAKKKNSEGKVIDVECKAYYEDCKEKNSCTIEIEVRNPTKNFRKYSDAIKNQLNYLKVPITFDIYSQSSEESKPFHVRSVDVKTDVLYEDDLIVIPEWDTYTVPHLVLNGINYGNIDFPEMELDVKRGNVGIKIDPSKLDVNQSRESVKYSDKTAEAIQEALVKVTDLAGSIIAKEFEGATLKEWIENVGNSQSKSSNITQRLKGLIDESVLSYKFKGDYATLTKKDLVDSNVLQALSARRTDVKKVKQALHIRNIVAPFITSDVVLLKATDTWDKERTLAAMWTGTEFSPVTFLAKPTVKGKELDMFMEFEKYGYPYYSDIEIKKSMTDFLDSMNISESEEEVKGDVPTLSPAEIRALEQRTLYFELNGGYADTKCEPKLSELDLDENFIYGTSDEEDLLYGLSKVLKENPKYTVARVAKTRLLDFKGGTFVGRLLFSKPNPNTVKIMSEIKKWYTARKVAKLLGVFLPDSYYTAKYPEDSEIGKVLSKLLKYVTDYGDAYLPKDIESYLDSVAGFQEFIENHTEAEVAEEASKVFGDSKIRNASSADFVILDISKELAEHLSPLKGIFSNLDNACHQGELLQLTNKLCGEYTCTYEHEILK